MTAPAKLYYYFRFEEGLLRETVAERDCASAPYAGDGRSERAEGRIRVDVDIDQLAREIIAVIMGLEMYGSPTGRILTIGPAGSVDDSASATG